MYTSKPSYILAFHGLDEDIGRKILNGVNDFQHSHNQYDWLGDGIYFWESSPERARQWAIQESKRDGSKIKKPFVLGAILDLKTCLDLLDQKWIDFLSEAYQEMKVAIETDGGILPQNQAWNTHDTDFKKRELDCVLLDLLWNWLKNGVEILIQSALCFGKVTNFTLILALERIITFNWQ